VSEICVPKLLELNWITFFQVMVKNLVRFYASQTRTTWVPPIWVTVHYVTRIFMLLIYCIMFSNLSLLFVFFLDMLFGVNSVKIVWLLFIKLHLWMSCHFRTHLQHTVSLSFGLTVEQDGWLEIESSRCCSTGQKSKHVRIRLHTFFTKSTVTSENQAIIYRDFTPDFRTRRYRVNFYLTGKG